MKNFTHTQRFRNLLLTLIAVVFVQFIHGQSIIAGWDFDTTTNGGTQIHTGTQLVEVPKVYQANFGSGTIYIDGTNGSSNFVTSTNYLTTAEVGNFAGLPGNQEAGWGNPGRGLGIGGKQDDKHLVIKFSMTGYENLILSYDTKRNANGPKTHIWDWSVDGITWTNCDTKTVPTSNTTFTNITVPTGLNNQTEAYLRLTLTDGSGTAGVLQRNNQLDNIKLQATSLVFDSVVWTIDNEWSNGAGPTGNDDVIIEGFCAVGAWPDSFEAKTLTVAPGGYVYLMAGASATVKGQINVDGDGGFYVEKGGNLVQKDYNGANIGEITVQIEAMTEWYGYNMFSSPVAGQTFAGFSDGNPFTYIYEPVTYGYYDTAPGTVFQPGHGYLFSTPNEPSNFPLGVLSPFVSEFTGVPNNGNISVPIQQDSYIALGNPYPSAIDAVLLFVENYNELHTLYFWTNAHFWNWQLSGWGVDGEGDNYAAFSLLGGNGTPGFPVSDELTIEPGQGFLAAIADAGNVTFTNDMRRTQSDGAFYKTMQTEKHRFRLNLSKNNGYLNQILIGYMDGATEGVDQQIDGKMFGAEGSVIYSIIANETDPYVIQGRSLPFTDADVVPLGFYAAEQGNYTIALNDFDGIFESGQDIYLKDNLTQTIHDLKDSAYTFVSADGVFEERFEVVYKTTGDLNINNPELNNKWIVYSKGNGFQIETQGLELKEVEVYDLLGRTVYNSEAEGTSHTISNIGKGVLIVKVTTADNQTLIRKTAK